MAGWRLRTSTIGDLLEFLKAPRVLGFEEVVIRMDDGPNQSIVLPPDVRVYTDGASEVILQNTPDAHTTVRDVVVHCKKYIDQAVHELEGCPWIPTFPLDAVPINGYFHDVDMDEIIRWRMFDITIENGIVVLLGCADMEWR